jgi:hypothetical protein
MSEPKVYLMVVVGGGFRGLQAATKPPPLPAAHFATPNAAAKTIRSSR